MQGPLDTKLAARYGALSARLKQAADYVVENPLDATTRSLRAVANDSGLPPATFSRMARAIGYGSFEDLREDMRRSLGRRVSSFSQRAERLRADHGGDTGAFLSAHMEACIAKIRSLGTGVDPSRLEATVEALHRARRVVLLGGL
ncbi:MAG: MurR/RpiR family transcriptional regulator, partial [Paracoccaceae bacterium]